MSWGKCTLADIVTIKKGEYITKKDAVSGKYPVILGGKEPAYYINKYNHVGKAIVISRSGASAGYVSFWNEPIFITDGFLIEPKQNTTHKFLFYLLKSKQSELSGIQRGAAIPHVTPSLINSINVSLPDLHMQNRIASILSAYDDLIENNQKQIKLLEEAAQRLYKEWFVDLRFPGWENTKIVDGVPEGWERATVGSLLRKISRTKQILACDYQIDGTIPIIDQSRDFIAGYTNNTEARIELNEPIIVFGDHTRILKYITFPFAKGADGTQLIISSSDRMPQSLFYFSLIHVDLSNYHYTRHFKYLKESVVLVPTRIIAQSFDSIVQSIMSRIQVLRDNSFKAIKVRNQLIPKLMSKETEV